MKCLWFFCFLFCFRPALAAQKAKIVSPEVEIYSGADYDSEILDVVREGEVYFISDKTVGPFYKIKLKSGKIGFISDFEVDVAGKGRLPEKDLDEIFLQEEKKRLKLNPEHAEETDPEEEALFGKPRRGPTVQLITFHESVLGGDQTADLLAVGYRSISQFSWSVTGTYGAPKYYAEKTGGTATGAQLWGDVGFSVPLVASSLSELRLGGGVFAHLFLLNLDSPALSKNQHDVSLGFDLEAGWMLKFRKFAVDLGFKYYFDKSSYGALGLSVLF